MRRDTAIKISALILLAVVFGFALYLIKYIVDKLITNSEMDIEIKKSEKDNEVGTLGESKSLKGFKKKLMQENNPNPDNSNDGNN